MHYPSSGKQNQLDLHWKRRPQVPPETSLYFYQITRR